jgi:hypothetical protein
MYEELPGQMGMGGLTPQAPFAQPLDIRIIQHVGGFTINKHGGGKFYPLEVCVTIDEVVSKVNEFFTQESDKSNEQVLKEEAAPEVKATDLPEGTI